MQGFRSSVYGLIILFGLGFYSENFASEIQHLTLPLVDGIDHAEIYVLPAPEKPVACLVMCPGINGDGKHYLERQELQDFAQKNSLTLVALSFASNPETLKAGHGYYYASQGSGQLLLGAIDQNVAPGIPILLYGFSGGAHFVSNFEEWHPDRVMAWCAYTAAWWTPPTANSAMPPGIVACGDQDEDRYGVSLEYFRAGRKLGKPWCWVSMTGTNHAETPKLDAFVLAYFQGILDRRGTGGCWRNVESKVPLDDTPAVSTSAYASWLPNEEVANLWSVLHQP